MRILSTLAFAFICLHISTQVFADDLGDLYKKVSPAVVILHTFEQVPTSTGSSIVTSMSTAEGLGSGVLISDDGKILTAAHVVHLSNSVHVEFPNGKKVLGRVIASDPAADIALLQINEIPADAKVVPLGDSDQAAIGDNVFVVGAPYGIGQTLTVGYISGRHLSEHALSSLRKVEVLQTDAAINQGNSGGPMFNMQGEVIGVVSQILTKSGGFEGLGFVVSSNTVRNLLLDEKNFWSGIKWQFIQRPLANAFNVPQMAGVLVERVAQDSPADRAGIQAGEIKAVIGKREFILGGDIILAVDNISIEDPDSIKKIYDALKKKSSSESVSVKVYRQGRNLELFLTP